MKVFTEEHACRDLCEITRRSPWFCGVGVGRENGEECLILYVDEEKNVAKARLTLDLDGTFMGYKVRVVVSGKPIAGPAYQ